MFSLLNSFVPKVFSLLNIFNYKVYYTFEVGGSAKDGRQTAEVSNAWIAADEVWGIMRFKKSKKILDI